MRVAIIGAGGIGGYVGGRLAGAGHNVTLVARGRHLEVLQSQGLFIESPHGSVHLSEISATDRISDIGAVDVVIATVKMPDLDAAAREFPGLLGPSTRIVTLQNGIDARDTIGRHVDPEVVAQGVIYLAAQIKEPGTISTPGGKHMMLIDALQGDTTMAAFFEAVEQSRALDVTPVPDGDKIVWAKFTAQASIAAITALTRLPLGGVFASPEATRLLRQLLEESIDVANARGIALEGDHADASMALYRGQPGAQSSSLLNDINGGKATELAWLSGRVHQLGQELGVPTPGHSQAWLALAPFQNGPPVIQS